MAERQIVLNVSIDGGLGTAPGAPDCFGDLTQLATRWTRQVNPCTGAAWPDGRLAETVRTLLSGRRQFRNFAFLGQPGGQPGEHPIRSAPATGLRWMPQGAFLGPAHVGAAIAARPGAPAPISEFVLPGRVYLPQAAFLGQAPHPPAWIAAVAINGTSTTYTFWDGSHDDGGADFGYDQADLQAQSLEALLGERVHDAFAATGFGRHDGVGPASFGSGADGTVDLTLNQQAPITAGESPLDYAPLRTGSGPVVFPAATDVSAVAILAADANSVSVDSVVLPNATWTVVDSQVWETVLGVLCAGMIPAGTTSLAFSAGDTIAVSVLAWPNLATPVIVAKRALGHGTISDETVPMQIHLTGGGMDVFAEPKG